MCPTRVLFLPKGREAVLLRRLTRWAKFDFGVAGAFTSPRWSGKCVRSWSGSLMLVAESVYGVEEVPTIHCFPHPASGAL